MYKTITQFVGATLCSIALTGFFATQSYAYERNSNEPSIHHLALIEENNDFTNEFAMVEETDTAHDTEDLSDEEAEDIEDADDLSDNETTEEEDYEVESSDTDTTDNTAEDTHTSDTTIHSENNNLEDESDEEMVVDLGEFDLWTFEELLHEMTQWEQIHVDLPMSESTDVADEEDALTDEEIQTILDGTPTTPEELELYFYTKLGSDPFLMEYFYKNLETDKMLAAYFKGVEAFDLPEGYFTRTDDENRKLRAYFYQVLQVDPFFRDYFYRSEDTPEALEDKEMEEGAAFFKRGGRRITYRPAPKAVYRPRPRPVSKPTPRTKAISKPKVSPKLANKPTTKPTTRQIVKPNIIPVTPKPIPPKPAPKPNPPIQAPKTSSALEAADMKLPGGPKGVLDVRTIAVLTGEFTGYNDVFRLITETDPTTGKKVNRYESVGSLALNIIPGGLGKIGKVADAMNDLRKGAAIAKTVDVAGDTARTANAVDKLNDTRKVANAADKTIDAGKTLAKGTDALPPHARDTLDYINKNKGTPPEGYKGGKTYKNIPENGEQLLPPHTTYKEYDVHPKIPHTPRGPERLVIGADGSVWYTDNHYMNFTQIK